MSTIPQLPILIYERLTPPGRGAVATIRACGKIDIVDQLFHAANGRSIQQQIINQICYGHWGQPITEDLVCVRTEERSVEIHCHGGEAAVGRILSDLEKLGGVPYESTFDQLTIEEDIRRCLLRATTARSAHLLLRQMDLWPHEIGRLRTLPADERDREIESILRWEEFGRHLTQPWKVVLCGQPNVGKSSLINALVGYSRTLVYDQPGTTRDVVTVQTALEGWPIELSDTAGLRETEEQLESLGIAKAREQIATADLLLIVADARTGVTDIERELMNLTSRSLLVYNKFDLVQQVVGDDVGVQVSAINQFGIDGLAKEIVSILIPRSPSGTQLIPTSPRQVALMDRLRTR